MLALAMLSGAGQAGDPRCSPEHAAMGHCTPVVPPASPAAPAAPAPDAADRVWGREAMAASRAALRRDHGGGRFSQVMIDRAEYRVRDGRNDFHWDGESWFGGDIDRLVVKSEGVVAAGRADDDAEVQLLYSRAVGPYFNLQAGVRHDIAPGPSRTYATLGFEGLAPYWFQVEGAVFLSDRGEALARLEGYYDQRITQRLIVQPRIEIDLAAQDVPARGIAAGVSGVSLDLRLRYELRREFAPYVGVSWGRDVGDLDAPRASLVLGVRAWF